MSSEEQLLPPIYKYRRKKVPGPQVNATKPAVSHGLATATEVQPDREEMTGNKPKQQVDPKTNQYYAGFKEEEFDTEQNKIVTTKTVVREIL